MKTAPNPVETPVLDGSPAIVDSRIMYLQAMREGLVEPQPRETQEEAEWQWMRWAKFFFAYEKVMTDMGIKYMRLAHNQMPIDFAPGKNRVSLFDDFKTRDYEAGLLDRFGASVSYLGSVSVPELLRGNAGMPVPYVLKDTLLNKGEGKLLVDDEQKHRKLMHFLKSKRSADVQNMIIEEYVESPSAHNASYRVTITPGGTIHGAVITRSVSQKNSVRANWREAGRVFAPLTEPGNPYFIDSPRIASNRDDDKDYIGLDFPGRWYDLAGPSDQNKQILADHGIDPEEPVMPEKLLRAATDVGRVLGPGIGVHIGVDIIQAEDGSLHLLEVNANPEYTSIFKTVSPQESQLTELELQDLAFRNTLGDLERGVFAQTDIAA